MSCHVRLPQMISLMYRSFSLLPSCSGTMREYSGCACCWKWRCWPIVCKRDIFFLWDLILKEDTQLLRLCGVVGTALAEKSVQT